MAKFVKQGSFGYKDADLWDCEFAILSKNEYISLSRNSDELNKTRNDLSECRRQYQLLKNAYDNLKVRVEQMERMELLPEGMVAVPEEELNGYKKAVRIVRDRAKQQIDKAKADENGYTLLRAEKRKYGHDREKAWLITKSTPYSINMDLSEASAMIAGDLSEFYGFIKIPEWKRSGEDMLSRMDAILSVKDMLNLNEKYKNGDRSMMKNEKLLFYIEWLDGYQWKIIFDVTRIAQNHASGCYEVSYWALSPV